MTKKDPGHHGEFDTLARVRIGSSFRKKYYFSDYYIDDLHARIEALRKADCIRYEYDHIMYDKPFRTLDAWRKWVPGETVDSLDEYSVDFIWDWDQFTDRLLAAGDMFEQLGHGHIPTEPKELHNYVLDEDGNIQAIDIESSFIIVKSRGLYDRYIDNIRHLMRLEIRRYALLRAIEKEVR